ncbi:phosphoglycerate kinase [Moraxella macacae 0408225]|uniref:Phosphoglycerate kinase n=1 Tax=Moraxella macacae 0408225 TaxID=1230338 RepID=L2F9K4_9GAMM|nr:phosphoglycerate kinase [Moraxella macacae]ELA09722.1 phosphoglycerate kinase [Moraxella macacae 0408225]
MQFLRLQDLDLTNKTVLIREDLNVPINNGNINSDARLKASLPTIELALQKGAKVIICSHLGRPNPNNPEEKYSLAPIAAYLSEKLNQTVKFVNDYLQNGVDFGDSNVVLLENVRFNKGEKQNDEALSQAYADLCDVFVMDAFGTAHRAESSTAGVIDKAKIACAGLLLANELDALGKALNNPKKPMLAIVGGSKVSTKLDVLTNLAKLCDQIVVGGGIANTFLVANGVNVGASLYEADLVETAKKIMQDTDVLLPTEVVVAKKSQIDFDDFLGSLETADAVVKSVNDINCDEMILDISQDSANQIAHAILNAKTIIWNGPVGVFEVDKFGMGTQILSQAVANSDGFSIAGGGDTLAAIDKYGVNNKISYTSTGGGAFLEFVEGKPLPAVVALKQKFVNS